MKTKRIETPEDMPQLCTRVGCIRGGKSYELPADIADDLVKTRGAKPAGKREAKAARKAVDNPQG